MSWATQHIDVFVTGSDGQLWQWYFNNGDWQGWVPLGKPSAGIGGSPGAVSSLSWGYRRVDGLVRGGDGALWQKYFNKNGWQPWVRFADTAGKVAQYYIEFPEYNNAPAVCSWGANRLDVFFVDTTNNLQQKWFNGSWHLNPVGGTETLTASPSAVAWKRDATTTRIDIFARGFNSALCKLYYGQGSGWHGWYTPI